jgi:hypothetical protein
MIMSDQAVHDQAVHVKPKNPVPPQFVGKNWQPGQSGNPNGRPTTAPSKVRFSEVCKAMLASKRINIEYTFPDPKKNQLLTKTFRIESDKTIYHSVVAALIREALGGNITAIKELIDRCEADHDEHDTGNALVIQMKREIIDKRTTLVNKSGVEADNMKVLPMDSTTVEPDIVLSSEPDALKEALTTFLPSENAGIAINDQNMPKNDDISPIEPKNGGICQDPLKYEQNTPDLSVDDILEDIEDKEDKPVNG